MASHAHIRPKEVWTAIGELGFGSVAIAFLGCFTQVLFLVLRSDVLIPRETYPGARRVVYSIGLGHLMNTYFPARAGDVLKCFLLSQGGSPLSLLSAAGVLIGDRIIDITVLLGMAVAWKAYAHPQMVEWLSGVSIPYTLVSAGVLISALAGALFWFTRKGSRRTAKWTKEFWKGTACLSRPRFLLLGVLFAFISWSGEALALQALAQAQGTSLTFGNAVFVVVALNLAISVPLSFANVGPFEAAIALALSTFGMAAPQAVAVATIHHAIQLVVILAWGAIALLVRPRKLRRRPGS
jgi:uncharacterized membrane protein YbhN (UPF0104 family)